MSVYQSNQPFGSLNNPPSKHIWEDFREKPVQMSCYNTSNTSPGTGPLNDIYSKQCKRQIQGLEFNYSKESYLSHWVCLTPQIQQHKDQCLAVEWCSKKWKQQIQQHDEYHTPSDHCDRFRVIPQKLTFFIRDPVLNQPHQVEQKVHRGLSNHSKVCHQSPHLRDSLQRGWKGENKSPVMIHIDGR